MQSPVLPALGVSSRSPSSTGAWSPKPRLAAELLGWINGVLDLNLTRLEQARLAFSVSSPWPKPRSKSHCSTLRTVVWLWVVQALCVQPTLFDFADLVLCAVGHGRRVLPAPGRLLAPNGGHRAGAWRAGATHKPLRVGAMLSPACTHWTRTQVNFAASEEHETLTNWKALQAGLAAVALARVSVCSVSSRRLHNKAARHCMLRMCQCAWPWLVWM